MDNGGANATMMEVARLCAPQRAALAARPARRFWSGHSPGPLFQLGLVRRDALGGAGAPRAASHVNVDSTGGKGNTIVARHRRRRPSCAALAREAIAEQGGQELRTGAWAAPATSRSGASACPRSSATSASSPATGTANASAAVFGGGKRLGHGTGWWWHTPDDRSTRWTRRSWCATPASIMHALWRLLTEAVLPLDYAEHAAVSAGRARKRCRRRGGGKCDLGLLRTRAEALASACDRLNARRVSTGEQAATRNATLKALSRILVPLDYTEGDRFDHDPATPQGIYPALQSLRRLAATPAGSDEARFLEITVRRACNRVGAALAEALAVADRG